MRGEELHVEKASNKPTTTTMNSSNNHVSSSDKASHHLQRDIKAELTMLLEKLPGKLWTSDCVLFNDMTKLI